MDSDHPYRPPDADLGGPPAGFAGAAQGISPGMVEALRKTRPWVLLLGVLMLVLCGLMLLGGLGVVVAGMLGGLGEAFAPIGGLVIGLFYMLFGVLYLIPGVHLLRYGGAIGRIGGDPTAAAVEQALRRQLSFWRFVGIMTVVMLLAYAVFIVVAIIYAAASGM